VKENNISFILRHMCCRKLRDNGKQVVRNVTQPTYQKYGAELQLSDGGSILNKWYKHIVDDAQRSCCCQ